jgi:hypothetical protein
VRERPLSIRFKRKRRDRLLCAQSQELGHKSPPPDVISRSLHRWDRPPCRTLPNSGPSRPPHPASRRSSTRVGVQAPYLCECTVQFMPSAVWEAVAEPENGVVSCHVRAPQNLVASRPAPMKLTYLDLSLLALTRGRANPHRRVTRMGKHCVTQQPPSPNG